MLQMGESWCISQKMLEKNPKFSSPGALPRTPPGLPPQTPPGAHTPDPRIGHPNRHHHPCMVQTPRRRPVLSACRSCRPVGLSELSELSERRMTVTARGACRESLSGCRSCCWTTVGLSGSVGLLSEVTVGLSDRGSELTLAV